VNAKRNNNHTALMMASDKNQTEIMQLLIKAGAKE
jgi:ankyrin repeat protein